MGHHRSRRPTSSDSGYDTTSEGRNSPPNNRIRNRITKESAAATSLTLNSPGDSAGDEDAPLLSSATRTDLNPSIGTELDNIQLSNLNPQQLDELALLVSERGVVVFRDQDLSAEEQIRITEHYGATAGKHIVEKSQGSFKIKTSRSDYGEKFTFKSGRRNEWVSDRSFEVNPPSYSLVKVEQAGGDTVWVSQYGLYDSLSKHMKSFLDSLTAIHTSQLQYDTIVSLRGMPSNRAPAEAHHPAIRTHPVTGLKALNITPGSVTGFPDLTERESDKLLELLDYHVKDADEHTVRIKWEAGSVAIWDNRCVAYKSIQGLHGEVLKSTETAAVGEKPYFDPRSESRQERIQRLAREAVEQQKRLEEIKARYNNTPLRRILRAQASGGEPNISPNNASPSSSSSSHISEPQPNTPDEFTEELVPNSHTLAQNAKQLARDVDSEVHEHTGKEVRVEVISKGSPLRRIIQRQVSGNVGLGARERR